MGLEGTVLCNCFREGRATPPPFPLEWLETDRKGLPCLPIGYDSNENRRTLLGWLLTCCEHEEMQFACEYIANRLGMSLFLDALGRVGWDRFPTLKGQVPETCRGLTPASASAAALREVEDFASLGEIGIKTVLVDTSSGDEYHQHYPDRDDVFIGAYDSGFRVGLSESAFFVMDGRAGEELFRATRIEQFSKGGSPLTDWTRDVVWKDLDTGAIFEPGFVIRGKLFPWEGGGWRLFEEPRNAYPPARFHVEQRPRVPSEFEPIIQALRVVFAASVATGNPVRWS